MLLELHIQSFAIIDRLRIEFAPGLNIMTGETGAGKSIVIGALELVLGAKASADAIRSGEDAARVEAVFDIAGMEGLQKKLHSAGVAPDENTLVVRRDVTRSGRGRAYLNESPVSIALLADVGNHLVDIHGQHEHQTLLHPENHLFLVDAYGGLAEQRERVEVAYACLYALIHRREEILNARAQREQRRALLEFQVQEISNARLRPGELEDLARERRKLQNAERLLSLVKGVHDGLYAADKAIVGALHVLLQQLEEATKIDDALHPYVEEGRDAAIQLEELAFTLRGYADGVEFRPDRLVEVDERLEVLGELRRKYGDTVEEIERYGQRARQELAQLEADESSTEALGAEIEDMKLKLQDEALRLSRRREAVARSLEREIVAVLRTLHMERVKFSVALSHIPDSAGFLRLDGETVTLFPTGIDQVEFTFSPNVGEEAKPLARIASGGELSRVMLAMKAILAEQDHVPTLVFDEVDAGIGGKTAEVVGTTLQAVARTRQVFCITHLPQIASKGEAHYLIYKEVHRRRTRTRFKRLSESDRVEEIARMSGGKAITEATRRLAEEMLRGR